MFLPTLMNQCSPEQQVEWLERTNTNSILGTYAQVIIIIVLIKTRVDTNLSI